MASSRSGSSVINVEKDDDKSELQFQDFDHDEVATLQTSDSSVSFPDGSNLEGENEQLLSAEKRPASFWEFSYYQSFFDVDTDQVIRRIIWSMVPLKGQSTYLERIIKPTPDLYGPFWISTTLIFSIAISANIADYLMTEGKDKGIWQYDFHKVSLAATAIYSYVFLLPFALWGLMWYRQSSTHYTFLEILCVYGYSLFIYIPVSVLWLIPVSWMQWMFVIIGAVLSGLVLAQTFWPSVKDENRKVAVMAVCLIMLFHALLAAGFVTYFFRPTNKVQIQNVNDDAFTQAYASTSIKSAIEIEPKIITRDTKEKDQKNVTEIAGLAQVKNVAQKVDKGPVMKRKTNTFSKISVASNSKKSETNPNDINSNEPLLNGTLFLPKSHKPNILIDVPLEKEKNLANALSSSQSK